MLKSQSLCFQGCILTVRQPKAAVAGHVSIPLFSGLHTDDDEARREPGARSLNPFVFRAAY